ncbi:hypothetical protein QUB60_19820 [Microcoleus sp. A2-C5]|uniref:hypothetical protein n=1 Tax=Microcoleaceae TaxID=1892252 RepID=UPI0022371B0B|nr:hypothetical protein [Lyngbya sp. CCAP 1446/10]MCW6050251.1 hypothetical protein [Lyngbya sp. CCAP 1446/10]
MFYPLLFENIGKISSWLIAIGSLADRSCGLDGFVERNCDRFECAVRRSIEFEGISDESEVPYNLRAIAGSSNNAPARSLPQNAQQEVK